MVDRPIKKADRQNPPVESDGTPKSTEAPKKGNSSRGKDGGRDKGKRDSNKREDAKPPENLALMRGPKPSKAKPPVIKEAEPEVTEDAVTEDAAAEAETTAEA